jgi:alpha 1,3-glucosidase
VDYTNPSAINWWARQFAFDSFTETSENVQLWNDMNEPSIFNGPETTMEKQMVHFGGWEHRDLHNLYGMLMVGT